MFRSFMALVSLTLVASSGFATETSHRPCQVRNTMCEGWPAQVISNEWLEIVIVKRLGGRLMQVTFAGHTYLFVNPKYKGKYISPEQANGNGLTTEETSSGLFQRGSATNNTGLGRFPTRSTTVLMI